MKTVLKKINYKYLILFSVHFLIYGGFIVALEILEGKSNDVTNLIYCYSLYPFIYGLFSYLLTKKILIPHAMLFASILLLNPLLKGILTGEFMYYIEDFFPHFKFQYFLAAFECAVSVLISLITHGIFKLVREIKSSLE